MLFLQPLKVSEMFGLHKACIFVMIIVLIYDYNTMETSVAVLIKDPTFTLLGPHNTTSERVIVDDPEQLINIKDFKFLINPNLCQNITSLLLMVIVSSNPKNVQNRMAIRKTWGLTEDSTRLVFLVGTTTDALETQIRNESGLFGDIVQGNFIDAYRNMTYKHVMGLKWVAYYCPMAKYILKTDDDIVAHPDKLRHLLAKELSPWGTNNLILCPVHQNALVERSNSSKWMVKPEEYAEKHYPTYCPGYVILYSQNVVPLLVETAHATPFFWIDDVYVTGILADKIRVARTPLTTLILSRARSKTLSESGPHYAGQYLFGPPNLAVEEMCKLWKAMEADVV